MRLDLELAKNEVEALERSVRFFKHDLKLQIGFDTQYAKTELKKAEARLQASRTRYEQLKRLYDGTERTETIGD